MLQTPLQTSLKTSKPVIIVAVLVLTAVGLFFTVPLDKLVLQALALYGKPDGQFQPEDAVAPPNYALNEFWAALPEMDDPADLVPLGISTIQQGKGEADVFFIHPTGFLKGISWTSPMATNSSTAENTQWMMANQASAFNGCCNLYAPRYRQANIFAYFSSDKERDEILQFAYQDIKTAFHYYLKHYNQGRPFIIASHSQGSHHAKRLLTEEINPTDLHQRLVAAYLIGSLRIAISPDWIASLNNISACQSATDLQCIVHWDTVAEGQDAIERPQASLCTNPLSWKVNEAYAEAKLNEGSVVPTGTYNLSFGKDEDKATGQSFTQLNAPITQHTGAQCRNGTLFVDEQENNGFDAMGSSGTGNYHGLDFALFYMNIHNNAKLRVKRFLEQKGSAGENTAQL